MLNLRNVTCPVPAGQPFCNSIVHSPPLAIRHDPPRLRGLSDKGKAGVFEGKKNTCKELEGELINAIINAK